MFQVVKDPPIADLTLSPSPIFNRSLSLIEVFWLQKPKDQIARQQLFGHQIVKSFKSLNSEHCIYFEGEIQLQATSAGSLVPLAPYRQPKLNPFISTILTIVFQVEREHPSRYPAQLE